MGALTWQPSPKWTVEAYTDYERLPDSTDHRTIQGFVAYQTDQLRWSVLYSYQDREDDPPLEVASAFIVHRLGRRTSVVGRVDRLVGEGYRRVKLKVTPGHDMVVLAAVRSRHPDLELQVDANGSYGGGDLDALRALDEVGLTVIEQPVAVGQEAAAISLVQAGMASL